MTKNRLGSCTAALENALMGMSAAFVGEGKKGQNDPAGVGTFAWGAYGTYFWVDPKNELVAVVMAQVFPPDFT